MKVSLQGVSILAAVRSHLGYGPGEWGGLQSCNMCGEDHFSSHTTGHVTALCFGHLEA